MWRLRRLFGNRDLRSEGRPPCEEAQKVGLHFTRGETLGQTRCLLPTPRGLQAHLSHLSCLRISSHDHLTNTIQVRGVSVKSEPFVTEAVAICTQQFARQSPLKNFQGGRHAEVSGASLVQLGGYQGA